MAIIQMLFPAVFYVAASFLADWGKSLLMRSFQMAGFVFYHIICALAVLAFCFMYFRMGMSEKYRNTYNVIGLFAGGFLPIAVLGLAGYVVGATDPEDSMRHASNHLPPLQHSAALFLLLPPALPASGHASAR